MTDSGAKLLDSRNDLGAVRAARTLSAVVALGCGIAAATLLSFDDLHVRRAGWGWLTETVIGAVAFLVLLVRRRWSAAQAQCVSFMALGTALVAQVHSDWNSALSSARFAPFEGFKIAALAVATVVPFRPALAYVLVAVCAVMPVVLYAIMPAHMRAQLPVEAPWTTLVYPLFATGILMYRLRVLRVERETMRALAEREGLERFAKVSLAYRDLANSPLQSIELLRAQLCKKHPDSKELLDRLQSSVARLRNMAQMLSHSEHQVVWTSKEEAFDAAEVIAEFHRSATTVGGLPRHLEANRNAERG